MVSFSEPYLNSAQAIVVRGDSDAATLADLAGKNLGARVSFSALTALDANKQFRNSVNVKDEFSDNESMLNELESGNLDAALIDAVVADYYIAQNGGSLRKLDEVLTHEDHAIGFRMSDSSLIENVNRILHEMADDGTLAGISTKWLGADITAIQSNAVDTEKHYGCRCGCRKCPSNRSRQGTVHRQLAVGGLRFFRNVCVRQRS